MKNYLYSGNKVTDSKQLFASLDERIQVDKRSVYVDRFSGNQLETIKPGQAIKVNQRFVNSAGEDGGYIYATDRRLFYIPPGFHPVIKENNVKYPRYQDANDVLEFTTDTYPHGQRYILKIIDNEMIIFATYQLLNYSQESLIVIHVIPNGFNFVSRQGETIIYQKDDCQLQIEVGVKQQFTRNNQLVNCSHGFSRIDILAFNKWLPASDSQITKTVKMIVPLISSSQDNCLIYPQDLLRKNLTPSEEVRINVKKVHFYHILRSQPTIVKSGQPLSYSDNPRQGNKLVTDLLPTAYSPEDLDTLQSRLNDYCFTGIYEEGYLAGYKENDLQTSCLLRTRFFQPLEVIDDKFCTRKTVISSNRKGDKHLIGQAAEIRAWSKGFYYPQLYLNQKFYSLPDKQQYLDKVVVPGKRLLGKQIQTSYQHHYHMGKLVKHG